MSLLPAGYRMRPRRSDDDAALVAVERAAVELFRPYYPKIADEPFGSVEAIGPPFTGRRVTVAVDAGDRPVGFSVTGPVGGHLHLHELSVDPGHGRKGIGGALVEALMAEAREHGFAQASLTTFRDVPFNQPFYERLGFRELPPDAAPAALRECFFAEVPAGIVPEKRVLMVRDA